MSFSSLVQLPVGSDSCQEWILGIEGAGWGGEWPCDWLVSPRLPAPRGPFWFHRAQETSELASKAPRNPLQLGKGFSLPQSKAVLQHPTKQAELGYHVPIYRCRN